MMSEHLTVEDFDALLADIAPGRVRAHLEVCATCRKAWEEVLAAHCLLMGAEAIPAPAGFHDRVMAALDTGVSRPLTLSARVRAALLVLLGISGAAVGVLAVGTMLALVGGASLTPLARVLARVLLVFLHMATELVDVLALTAKVLVMTPWMPALVVVAVLSTLLALWTTRFYSRRLFAYGGG